MPQFDTEGYEPRDPKPVPPGDYPFEVVDAQDDVSSNDNEMIVMELAVDVGRTNPLKMPYVNLVFTKNCLYQIDGFCKTTGLTKQWDNEDLNAEDCIGVSGIVHLEFGAKKTQGKNEGKRFLEVQYFVKPEGYTESPLSAEDKKRLDKVNEQLSTLNPDHVDDDPKKPTDDIPF